MVVVLVVLVVMVVTLVEGARRAVFLTSSRPSLSALLHHC